jgi:hypothetical protein
MTARIIAFPPETSQQTADRVLAEWQRLRKAGLRPDQRLDACDAFERDLAIIRQLMERSR